MNSSLYASQYREGSYVPVIDAYYDRASMRVTTEAMLMHRHDLIEVMYVSRGSCDIQTSEGVFRLRTGAFVLLDAMAPHRLLLKPMEDFSMLNIEFHMAESVDSGATLRSLACKNADLAALLNAARPSLLLMDTDGMVLGVLRQAVALADSVHPEARQLCSLLTGMLLLLAGRCFRLTRRTQTANPHIKAALALMEAAEPTEPLSPPELAHRLGITSGYLHSLFRRELGQTPGEYMTEQRLARAKVLLTDSALSVSQISLRLGWVSAGYFSRLFKRKTGYSPTEFRRRARQPSCGVDRL